MRILHVASEYPPQHVFGLGRYVCEISREAVRQGHLVHVLTNSIGGKTKDALDLSVCVHRVEFPPPPKPPGSVAPALAFNLHLLQRATSLGLGGLGNPEVVVSHDWLTATAAHHLAKRWGLPHVWTVHDTVRGKCTARAPEESDRITGAIERWAAREADLIVVNSGAIREEVIADGADPELVRGLPCGISPDTCLTRQSTERLAALRQVFARPDEILLTFVGRLDVEKGIDTLINACARLRDEGLQFRLALAGSGLLEQTIREHIQALRLQDRITLCGYLKGEVLRAFYAISDLHICPSHYEPFGIVALEAMIAGKPVVVSAIGGLAEIINDDSIGRRVVPRDVGGLAACIGDLMRNPRLRHELGVAAARRARLDFSWEHVVRRAVALYAEAASGRTALATSGAIA